MTGSSAKDPTRIDPIIEKTRFAKPNPGPFGRKRIGCELNLRIAVSARLLPVELRLSHPYIPGFLMKRQQFTVSNGKMVLILEAAEEGGYIVSSPFDPALLTQAETIEEAFENASDAALALREARRALKRDKLRKPAKKLLRR
jgi:predicted RNase H-like HicB family nuclease